MTSRNKCDCCTNKAQGRYVWGLYEEPNGIPRTTEMQVADLCGPCSDELWQKIKGAVNQGLMHFAIPNLYELDEIIEDARIHQITDSPIYHRQVGEKRN